MSQDISIYAPMNPTFEILEVEATDTKSTIVIEPLEQGYGHTLGNALRRVLLTSLPGYAITQVKVNGVDHQFTTLEGLGEDIVELILNLKQVKVKSESSTPGILRISAKGAGEVLAKDIECEAGYEIVNKDLHIATLSAGKKLEVEMIAAPGMGYQLASEKKVEAIGEIPVDSLFSPVIKVSYKVEATRVGRRTDFDKVLLNIETDGTLAPIEAVKQAAAILARQFTQVFNPILPEVEEVEEKLTPEEAETLRLTVEELDLPTRIANALRKGGFKTVGDLAGAPKLTVAKVKNLGEKSVDVINEALAKKGVSLGE